MPWRIPSKNSLYSSDELQACTEEINHVGVSKLAELGLLNESEDVKARIDSDPSFPKMIRSAFDAHGKRGSRSYLGTLEDAVIRRRQSEDARIYPTVLFDTYYLLEQDAIQFQQGDSLVGAVLRHQLKNLWGHLCPVVKQREHEFANSMLRVSDAIQIIQNEMARFPTTEENPKIGIGTFLTVPQHLRGEVRVEDILEGFPKIDSISIEGPKRNRSSYKGKYFFLHSAIVAYFFVERFLIHTCGLPKNRACYAGGILLWYAGILDKHSLDFASQTPSEDQFVQLGNRIAESIRIHKDEFHSWFITPRSR